MGGEFFTPPPPPHRCELPPTTTAGIGWRCDCGKAYLARFVYQHGESWTEWARAPEHDGG